MRHAARNRRGRGERGRGLLRLAEPELEPAERRKGMRLRLPVSGLLADRDRARGVGAALVPPADHGLHGGQARERPGDPVVERVLLGELERLVRRDARPGHVRQPQVEAGDGGERPNQVDDAGAAAVLRHRALEQAARQLMLLDERQALGEVDRLLVQPIVRQDGLAAGDRDAAHVVRAPADQLVPGRLSERRQRAVLGARRRGERLKPRDQRGRAIEVVALIRLVGGVIDEVRGPDRVERLDAVRLFQGALDVRAHRAVGACHVKPDLVQVRPEERVLDDRQPLVQHRHRLVTRQALVQGRPGAQEPRHALGRIRA